MNCRNVLNVALHPIESSHTRSPWPSPARKSADKNTLVFSILGSPGNCKNRGGEQTGYIMQNVNAELQELADCGELFDFGHFATASSSIPVLLKFGRTITASLANSYSTRVLIG